MDLKREHGNTFIKMENYSAEGIIKIIKDFLIKNPGNISNSQERNLKISLMKKYNGI